jgi:hypothetical protein
VKDSFVIPRADIAAMKERQYQHLQSGEATTTMRREHRHIIDALIEVGVEPYDIVAYLKEQHLIDVDF